MLESEFGVEDEGPLTIVRSKCNARMSDRFCICIVCSSSADCTTTYTINPRRSRSSAIARVIGSCGDPAMTDIQLESRKYRLLSSQTYQLSPSSHHSPPVALFSSYYQKSGYPNIKLHPSRRKQQRQLSTLYSASPSHKPDP